MIAAHNRRTSDTVERLVVRKIMILGGGVVGAISVCFGVMVVCNGEPTAEGGFVVVGVGLV